MKKLLIACVLMLGLTGPAEAGSVALSRFYSCEGTVDGEAYKVSMQTRSSESIVQFRQMDAHGRPIAFGYGFIVKGGLFRRTRLSLTLQSGSGQQGSITYVVVKKGKLVGTWVVAGVPVVNTETCVPIEGIPAPVETKPRVDSSIFETV